MWTSLERREKQALRSTKYLLSRRKHTAYANKYNTVDPMQTQPAIQLFAKTMNYKAAVLPTMPSGSDKKNLSHINANTFEKLFFRNRLTGFF